MGKTTTKIQLLIQKTKSKNQNKKGGCNYLEMKNQCFLSFLFFFFMFQPHGQPLILYLTPFLNAYQPKQSYNQAKCPKFSLPKTALHTHPCYKTTFEMQGSIPQPHRNQSPS